MVDRFGGIGRFMGDGMAMGEMSVMLEMGRSQSSVICLLHISPVDEKKGSLSLSPPHPHNVRAVNGAHAHPANPAYE